MSGPKWAVYSVYPDGKTQLMSYWMNETSATEQRDLLQTMCCGDCGLKYTVAEVKNSLHPFSELEKLTA